MIARSWVANMCKQIKEEGQTVFQYTCNITIPEWMQ